MNLTGPARASFPWKSRHAAVARAAAAAALVMAESLSRTSCGGAKRVTSHAPKVLETYPRPGVHGSRVPRTCLGPCRLQGKASGVAAFLWVQLSTHSRTQACNRDGRTRAEAPHGRSGYKLAEPKWRPMWHKVSDISSLHEYLRHEFCSAGYVALKPTRSLGSINQNRPTLCLPPHSTAPAEMLQETHAHAPKPALVSPPWPLPASARVGHCHRFLIEAGCQASLPW